MLHTYAGNFYHFMAETLPKYYMFAPLLRAHPDLNIIAAHKWQPLINLFFGNESFGGRTFNMRYMGLGVPFVYRGQWYDNRVGH